MTITPETPMDAGRRLATGALRNGFKFEALHTYTDREANEAKSAVGSVFGRKFLGYSLWAGPKGEVKRKVAAKPMATFKQRIRQLSRRSGGRSMHEVVQRLRP